MAEVRRPVDKQLFVGLFDQTFRDVLTVVQCLAIIIRHFVCNGLIDNPFVQQLVDVQFTSAFLLANLLVHQRLGTGGLISLVVSTAAIADQIDHDIFAEFLAEIGGQLRHEEYRFRVITIHMENRRLHHFGNVSTVFRRARIFLQASGETHLVIDDYVNGTAGFVGAGLRHLERLHHHTLPSKGRVAVQYNRHDLITSRVATAILTGPYRAFNHWRNNFKVRGVECQCQVNFTTRRHHIRREALVVLHIGRPFVLHLAFELIKQFGRIFTQRIYQNVETTAVRHTDHDFLRTVFTAALDHRIHHRDQTFTAFKAETFGTGVLGAQRLFQAFSRRQTLKQMFAHFRTILRL